MKVNSLFTKTKNASKLLKKYNINYSNVIYVLFNDQINEMKEISKIFIKFISELYKNQEYHNSELQFVAEIQNLPTAVLTFSPMRLDFLIDGHNSLILSDINLPGSFVPDLFWPFLSMKENLNDLHNNIKNYTFLNAYHYYHKSISKYFNHDYSVVRFLDRNTTKPKNQIDFINRLYKLISDLNFIRLRFINKEIDAEYISALDSKHIISLFLNTHNSPKNLIDSIKLLLESNRPIFVDPKLLPFTDKKPPSLEVLKTILKDNEAEYLKSHLPRLSDGEQEVTKRRFGHSSSSFVNKLSCDIDTIINRDLFAYPEVNIEKLEALPFQGLNKKAKYSKYIFEISLNTFIVTKKDSIIDSNECVSVSSRGAISHPISGPHTLLFPTMVKR